MSQLLNEEANCVHFGINVGVAGATVASTKAAIDTILTGQSVARLKYALINLGVNDGSSPDETTWKTNYQYIIDAVHTKWSEAKIYIAKPWKLNTDAKAITMAGWIDDLITANSGVCYEGHNEYVWLKGTDNGATYTSDGTHYSDAGKIEVINQWMAALGY